MRFLYRIFTWVAIGFGYQIMAYGPDTWTSMAMAGHVLGWPVFFVVWLIGAALSIGVWIGIVTVALVAAALLAIRIEDWRLAAARRRALKARLAR